MRDRVSGSAHAARRRRADMAGGLAVAGLGALELLDALEVLELSFGGLAPAVLAVIGVILVGRGLSA